ncbi:hypothetical protein QBC42DRAFT_72965 [Cladorrhinum samala]|uniref:Uncharacterized protein n=1 Tax=Cladorrhinum samala TaxID=585594 RepID=A0AAV9HT46_9PEZI|nr:hypothetical protein QBC42DRAFT_72965 [Cladorrhinum samala]
MALNYDPKHRITQGFFGYMSLDGPGLGEAVLDMLRVAADKISEPLIVPLAMYEQLTEGFQSLMIRVDNGLDIFERDGRFIENGLGRYSGGDYDLTTPHGFDEIHKTVVNQHARLTNRSTRFLNLLGSSLERGISILECHFGGNPADQAGAERLYDGFYSRQCLQAMLNRSDYTYGLRELLLQRVSVYLQVVQNFMQQEISRETKRDSSAMKSLSLLTMVFLPATAVATIMAPFTKISDDDDTLRIITGQFWKFWAVAGPITLVVLIAWVCWIQRIYVRKALATKMEQLKQIEMLQRRTKAADAESDASSTGTTSSSSRSTRQPSVLSRRSTAAGGSGSIRRSAASIREQGSVKDTGSIRGSIVAETSNSQGKSVVLTQKEKQ